MAQPWDRHLLGVPLPDPAAAVAPVCTRAAYRGPFSISGGVHSGGGEGSKLGTATTGGQHAGGAGTGGRWDLDGDGA